MNKPRICSSSLAYVVAVVCLSSIVWSQQQSTDQASPQSAKTSDQAPADSSPYSQDSSTISQPEEAQFRFLRGGGLVGVQPGFIHIGPIYVNSVEALGTYNTFSESGGTNDVQRAGDIRASLFYDKQLAHSRIAFQYRPQVAIVNGTTEADFVSHDVAINSYFRLGRRWNLNISDQFNYIGKLQNLFPDGTLSFDASTGFVAQNSFLVYPGRYVVNSSNLSLGYDVGTRTKLTVSPILNYAYNSLPDANRGLNYGGQVGISRRITSRRTAGVYYSAERNEFSTVYSSTWYHTVGVSYSEQLGRRTFIQGAIGASAFDNGNSRHWTGQWQLSLTKAFGQSSFSAAYSRRNAFVQTLRNGFSDEVDCGFTHQWTRKLQTSLWGGVYGEIWVPQHATSAYGRLSLAYRLFSNISWYGGYIYRKQTGDAAQLLLGRQEQAVTGFQWAPAGSLRY